VATQPDKLAISRVCSGTWNDLPVGWARFCDLLDGCSPLKADGNPVFAGDEEPFSYLFGSAAVFIRVHGDLSAARIAHALGWCECAGDTENIIYVDEVWWDWRTATWSP
jgi:hypothetical protein